MYAKDLSEPKYKYLIKKREDAGIKHVNNPNAFIKCSNTMFKCTKKLFNFFTIDTTLPASDPLRFRKNLFESL